MALIRAIQHIDNTVWSLTFINDVNYLSEGDKKAMQKFGEPEIDLGGTFLEGSANEYTLPAKFAKLRADFPFTQSFDSRDPDFETATQTKVDAYRDEIITRITDALTTLRAIPDTFTGEKTYNI